LIRRPLVDEVIVLSDIVTSETILPLPIAGNSEPHKEIHKSDWFTLLPSRWKRRDLGKWQDISVIIAKAERAPIPPLQICKVHWLVFSFNIIAGCSRSERIEFWSRIKCPGKQL
jgi:hypothetical protein